MAIYYNDSKSIIGALIILFLLSFSLLFYIFNSKIFSFILLIVSIILSVIIITSLSDYNKKGMVSLSELYQK